MRIHAPAAALAIVTTLVLGGCVPSEPSASPTPEPSATPVFASEEEALAAAEEAYAAYLAVSDAIAQDGGANPQRLADFVTPEWLEKEVAGFEQLAASGRTQTGQTSARGTTLQQYSQEGAVATVIAYVCTDFSGTRFVDSTGADVTPVDRIINVSLQVSFETGAENGLLISGSEPWSGATVC